MIAHGLGLHKVGTDMFTTLAWCKQTVGEKDGKLLIAKLVREPGQSRVWYTSHQ